MFTGRVNNSASDTFPSIRTCSQSDFLFLSTQAHKWQVFSQGKALSDGTPPATRKEAMERNGEMFTKFSAIATTMRNVSLRPFQPVSQTRCTRTMMLHSS
ncbi:hypothetical protein RvY_09875 [Ramazzottius varieornatus]|uniref:Uncharacterized protein n=1 Tax=Ramazzottius varieornatus TaxID=947166 RepID=A0A1D1VAW1_RAMVA|nr:hypothetical protein RvY_09875 [Ramazzottius varieornatus]